MLFSEDSYDKMCTIAFGRNYEPFLDHRAVFAQLNKITMAWIREKVNDGMGFHDSMYIINYILANKNYTSFPQFASDVLEGTLYISETTARWIDLEARSTDGYYAYDIPKAERNALEGLFMQEEWIFEWIEYWRACQRVIISRSSSSSSISSETASGVSDIA